MVGTNCRWIKLKRLVSFLMAAVLALSLGACGDRKETSNKSSGTTKTQITGSLLEVAPPPAIQQLSQSLAVYQPQVSILSPQADEVIQDTTLTVQLQVQDLPIFQNPDLGMGPHLEVILDNNPDTMVYDLKQPLVFPDLAPGTHTLRVLAATPWNESFKNDGAYAQTTFHVFTKTTDNNPDPALPLLTYSRPTGSYGAEPILLDFYLTNAPLHLVAQENPDDKIADWRIRATVNGQSFILDRWQSIYLKGFKPGKNWVQLEFLDEQGNLVKNVFNNTVRLIDYQPKGKDTLSKLVRGELTSVAARGIVEQDYQTQPTPESTPTLNPSPEEAPTENPSVAPPEAAPSQNLLPEVEATPTPEAKVQPKSGGFFGRFRRQPETPIPSPELVMPEEPQAIETPGEVPPDVEQLPPTSEKESPADVEELPPTAENEVQPKSGGFFSRFRRQPETLIPSPKLPEDLEVPAPETNLPEVMPPEASEIPSQSPTTVEEPEVPAIPRTAPKLPTKAEAQPPNLELKEAPKLDLKQVLLAPPKLPPKIIVTPSAEAGIPERFLNKTATEGDDVPRESESLETPTVVPQD